MTRFPRSIRARFLMEEFLVPMGVTQNRLGSIHRRSAASDQRDRARQASDHGGYGSASGALLQHECAVLDQPAGAL